MNKPLHSHKNHLLRLVSLLAVVLVGLNGIARAQEPALAGAEAPAALNVPTGTSFTYQGQLKDASGPVTASCDFQLSLWDALTAGTQIGSTQTRTGVAVSEGLFTVTLDFGNSAFDGNARWLEIAVRCPSGGSYATLTPRQPLTPAPYSLYSANAGTAANLSGVLPVSNGGTGSATKNFVDLSTDQPVGGVKTFSSAPSFAAPGAPFSVSSTEVVTNLNADQLDGLHASAFQQHYQNLLAVAKSGGDFTTITDALNSITTNSAANPFTIYVAPGVYTETVTMKPYVDIEGAGEQATKITFTNTGSYVTGTVVGTNNAELRFLTVESTGGSAVAYAIYNSCGSSLRITHVTAIASGGWNYTSGVVTACGSSPTLINVTAIAFGASNNTIGVDSYNSLPTMTNVTASASGGTQNYGVYNDLSSSRMTNVTAFASGETSINYGVYNDQSSPRMTNMTAYASGGTENYGVYNQSSSPVMINVIATASGGSNNYGMWNLSSSLTIQNSVISASGGTNDGLHNVATSGSYTVKINNSQISASTSTIYQDSHYTTQVGASQLAGAGAFGGGTYLCVASYNGSYTALDSTCH